eukprot:Tbor_TRINITY_DN5401_c6_g7::TRINITY_DN5401_c6_g7_i1::g.24295::m.24295
MGGSQSKSEATNNTSTAQDPSTHTTNPTVIENNNNNNNTSNNNNKNDRPRYRPASEEAIKFRDAVNNTNGYPQGLTKDALTISDPNVTIRSAQDYIYEQEGLTLGEERRRQLSKQWLFILSSEPLQRGIDAGILSGAATAAGVLLYDRKKYKAMPARVCFYSIMGFCVGMMGVPFVSLCLEERNRDRIRQMDREKMMAQREDYYREQKGK